MKIEMIKIKAVFLIVFLCSMFSYGQQVSHSSFLYENTFLSQPSWQNDLNRLAMGLAIQGEWEKDYKSSRYTSFFLNAKVTPKFGLGFTVNDSRAPMEEFTNAAFDFKFNVSLEEEISLSFGLRVGGEFYEIIDGGASVALQNTKNVPAQKPKDFNTNVGAGLHAQIGDYYVAFSTPATLSRNRLVEEEGLMTQEMVGPYYYFAMGGRTTLDDRWSLNSAIQFSYNDQEGLTEAMSLLVEYNSNFSMGGNLKDNSVFYGIGMWHVPCLRGKLGYAHRLNSGESSIAHFEPKHELLLFLALP